MINKKEKYAEYHKEKYDGLICFVFNTDFRFFKCGIGYTIYKIGWFRNALDKAVLMIREYNKKPIYLSFNNEKNAEKYVLKDIRSKGNKFVEVETIKEGF